MKLAHWTGFLLVAISAALIAAGCSQQGGNKEQGKQAQVEKKGDKHKGHDHSGWWCTEHGVPEDQCSLCLPEDDVNKKFKAKGDWCELHDRAKSQCFKCDPKLYERFAAMYKAKFGKEPPRPPEEEFKK